MALTGGTRIGGNPTGGIRLLTALTITLSGVSSLALADERSDTRAGAQNWTGFYVGGHVGESFGSAKAILSEPPTTSSRIAFESLYGGIHAGYNSRLPSGILLGIEADISFPNYFGADDHVWAAKTATSHVTEKVDYVGSVRGRLGLVFDRWLAYGTGGLAWSSGHFFQSAPGADGGDPRSGIRTGWSLGGGIAAPIDRAWSARLEYLYSHFGSSDVVFASGARYESAFDLHAVRLGLDRKFGQSEPEAGEKSSDTSTRWEIHGQTTYVHQGYPPFQAPYSGTNSLTPNAQAKETWTTSAFLGVRLWHGGEFYYNPELLQGFGLSDTTGAAGFPNGEAQKSGFLYPHYNTSRLFLRQTFGLDGEKET